MLQKSHEGLLRSLIYEILEQCPDSIPTICPHRWMLSGSNPSSHSQSRQPAWTLSDLQSTMIKLKEQEEMDVKFCFFIDGLDEYSGDHSQLCQILKQLAESLLLQIMLIKPAVECL